jgi:sec-independent protein translocase protein TatB
MFDISWSEFVLIGVIALIVIGPKELPAVLRAVGQWTTKIRRMAAEFQSQFQEAMREAEMADLKKEVDNLADSAKGLTSFDPLDFKEATKWEPKDENKIEDKASDGKSEPKSEPDSAATTPVEETSVVATAAASDIASHSETQLAPDAAAVPPRPTAPVPEGSGPA